MTVFPPGGGRPTPKASDEGEDKQGSHRNSELGRSKGRRFACSSSPSSGPAGHLPPPGGKDVVRSISPFGRQTPGRHASNSAFAFQERAASSSQGTLRAVTDQE